jgi:hypothetical protein
VRDREIRKEQIEWAERAVMGARPRNRVRKIAFASVPDEAPGRDGASGSACTQTRDATDSTTSTIKNVLRSYSSLLILSSAIMEGDGQ